VTVVRKYRALRISVVLLAVWYVPLTLFAAFYPYCHVGEDAVCYFGVTNYGALYDTLWWLSYFWALPFAAIIIGAFIYAKLNGWARVQAA